MPSGLNSCEGTPDTTLMLRVRWGDERAFAELYRRYYRRLTDFFYGMGRDFQVSEDLCQETFLRVWKLRTRYAATGSFAAYLFAFARNVWLEKCRESKKRRGMRLAGTMSDGWPHVAATASNHPDEVAARAEVEERIFDALGRLPDEQRMVFVMRNIQGLSIEEIALAMQCPMNTVRSRKLLAIKKLREALKSLLVL
jgi:RNA polymerase sigma-70 factor (ECF subfamily)